MRARFAGFFIAAALLVPFAAQADDAPEFVSIGSAAVPQESVISMEKEVVRFTVPKDFGTAPTVDATPIFISGEASFWLKNPTADPVTLQTVFPLYIQQGGPVFSNEYGVKTEYARNVKAMLGGQRIEGTYKEEATYAVREREGDPLTLITAPGYSFPITIPAKSTRTLVITFDAPQTYADGWYYLLASGSGWSGPIGKATIEVVYPYPLRKDWMEIVDGTTNNAVAYTISDKTATVVYTNYEPVSQSYLNFRFLSPFHAIAILDAEKAIAAAPNNAALQLPLLEAYRAISYYHGYVPDYVKTAYWQAFDIYADKVLGTKTEPKTLEDAEFLLSHYGCLTEESAGYTCHAFSDLEKARAVTEYVKNTLALSLTGDDSAAAIALVDKAETWISDEDRLIAMQKAYENPAPAMPSPTTNSIPPSTDDAIAQLNRLAPPPAPLPPTKPESASSSIISPEVVMAFFTGLIAVGLILVSIGLWKHRGK